MEYGDANEVLLQGLEAGSLSQYSKQTYSANGPVIIKIKHTRSTACLARNYSAHSVCSTFRRGRGLHSNQTVALISAG